MNILLLTACIHPKSRKNKIDMKKREAEYLDALNFYINESNFTHIVFVDNSNTVLDCFKNEKMDPFVQINGKTIEYLTFDWNKLTSVYEYWFWESEILDYAIENSEILKNMESSDSFFKITGRYVIKNINELINKSWDWLFFRWIWWFSCVTAIFKITKDKFKKLLYEKVKTFYIDKSKWRFITLETVYYILLREELYKHGPKEVIFCYRYLNNWKIRHSLPIDNQFIVKIFYGLCYILKLNQFWILSKLFDYCFYDFWYEKKFSL